jgi:hypothetical protein
MTKHLLQRFGAVVLVAALTTTPAAAQVATQDNTAFGGASGEFLLLGAGARGAALGNGFAALATDVTALYYNPGGLALLTRPSATVSSTSYIDNTRYNWLGIAFPTSGGSRAIGVSFGAFGFGDQAVYTVENPDGDGRTYSVRETFLGGTYSQNFSDRFSAGITIKYISDRLGTAQASAFAMDFGTNFHAMVGARPIRASFVIQNLGTNLQHQGEDLAVGVPREPPLGTVDVPQELQPARLATTAWTLPVLFRVGVALDVVSQGSNKLTLLSEFSQPNNTKPGAGAGFEWAMSNIGQRGFSLAARGSYSIQPDNQTDDIAFGIPTSQSSGTFTSDGLALGGGIGYERGTTRFAFDYAWKSLGTLGSVTFLSFTVGW